MAVDEVGRIREKEAHRLQSRAPVQAVSIAAMVGTEAALRGRLNIPSDAEKVLVITESSHWDPDWMLTSRGYFRLRVRRNLDQALAALIEEPRRVYGVECAFFLRMYWEKRPDRQDAIRELVNSGRLRLMGSGVTTPDTIIPSTEALVRDYLVGQEWYRANGMTVEPEVAYFPDSFGHTPAMPAIMSAVGVTGVAVCRIDGQFFLGCETESGRNFPRTGSSAELLMKEQKTQDFVWRGPDGSEILAHWVAYGYGMGELIAHAGFTRVAGAPAAVPFRTEAHVAKRVAGYVAKLSRHARTPYMLCPIGFDFSAPIHRLVDLLDRYNRVRYPATGTWVVNAGLDDYLALVGCHRDRLPVIDFDPNPYFAGFYASRTTVKSRCRKLVAALLSAETGAIASGDSEVLERVRKELVDPWWIATTSNHHDFVTGTGTDRVVRKEQLPWLDGALRRVEEVGSWLPASAAGPYAGGESSPVSWTRDGARVEVTAGWGKAVFDGEKGGSIVAVECSDGLPLSGAGPLFDVLSYEDTGGLWRMGMEYKGGVFACCARASDRAAELTVREVAGGVEVNSSCEVDGAPLIRRVRVLSGSEPGRAHLEARFEYRVRDDRTVTCLFPLLQCGERLVTDVPGGVVSRPAGNVFDPSFWPVQSFVHLGGSSSGLVPDVARGHGSGLAVFLALPGAVALRRETSTLEVVLMRNATKERFCRVLPIPGFPARGHDPGPHSVDLALCFTEQGDWRANRLVYRAREFAWSRSGRSGHSFRADRLFEVDNEEVAVLAAKPADRGQGVVVRLASTLGEPVPVRLRWPGTPLAGASLCDGRERDIADLAVDGDATTITMEGGIASVRLVRHG